MMRTDKEKDLPQSTKALCICGFIAVDKYTLLPTRYVDLHNPHALIVFTHRLPVHSPTSLSPSRYTCTTRPPPTAP